MRRTFLGAATLAVVALTTVVLVSAASAAKPTSAPNNTCPSNPKGLPTANNVGATATTSGNTTTYTFDSFVNQNPVGGVPGLINYCVYPNKPSNGVTASAVGADGSKWAASKPGSDFGFSRPGGDASNIPLNGTSGIAIGTATWATVPTTQTIVLHISDSSRCGTSPTCFVLPGTKPGPVCNTGAGNTKAGYNSMPFDVQHCSPASYAFEGNFANEFGDKVTLDTSAGTHIQSMTVDFQSYGCGDSGRWYTADCKTASGETFTIPGGITASIYDPAVSLTTPIATSTINPQIPFRPSAILDAGNCPNPPAPGYPADSRFKDPVSGQCNNSLSVPLTFTFTGQPLPSTVVWTVQFNTTHAGYSPVDEAATCVNGGNAPGCGYDSLNVGTKSYDNAPYAGTDPDENTVYISNGNSVWSPPFVGLAPITSTTDWVGYRPLAEIDLGP